MAMPEKKDCPDCGMVMLFDMGSGLFYCQDKECGYSDLCEDGNPVELEEEDEEVYRCPHCMKIIEEDDLPTRPSDTN